MKESNMLGKKVTATAVAITMLLAQIGAYGYSHIKYVMEDEETLLVEEIYLACSNEIVEQKMETEEEALVYETEKEKNILDEIEKAEKEVVLEHIEDNGEYIGITPLFNMLPNVVDSTIGDGTFMSIFDWNTGNNILIPDEDFHIFAGQTVSIVAGGVVNGNIYVWEDAKLYMEEGARINGGVHVMSSWGSDDGSFIMNGGIIAGSMDGSWKSQGVHVTGVFEMNGGTIAGHTSMGGQNGAGVHVTQRGIFIMNDGRIIDNSITPTLWGGNGGGVHINTPPIPMSRMNFGATFIMNGGEISGNTANHGGGVYVGNNTTFEMNGGQISGNTADYGGGVWMTIFPENTFIMTDGEISNNIANDGGAIWTEWYNSWYCSWCCGEVSFENPHMMHIEISEDATFRGNVARNGIFLNDNVAAQNPQIIPGMASVAEHVFNNFDINVVTSTSEVHNITFAVRDEVGGTITTGNITVQGDEIGQLFVREGANVAVSADSFEKFTIEGWYINGGTRQETLESIIATEDKHIEVLFVPFGSIEEGPGDEENEEKLENEYNESNEQEQGKEEPDLGKVAGVVVNTSDESNISLHVAIIGLAVCLMLKALLLKEKRKQIE